MATKVFCALDLLESRTRNDSFLSRLELTERAATYNFGLNSARTFELVLDCTNGFRFLFYTAVASPPLSQSRSSLGRFHLCRSNSRILTHNELDFQN